MTMPASLVRWQENHLLPGAARARPCWPGYVGVLPTTSTSPYPQEIRIFKARDTHKFYLENAAQGRRRRRLHAYVVRHRPFTESEPHSDSVGHRLTQKSAARVFRHAKQVRTEATREEVREKDRVDLLSAKESQFLTWVLAGSLRAAFSRGLEIHKAAKSTVLDWPGWLGGVFFSVCSSYGHTRKGEGDC